MPVLDREKNVRARRRSVHPRREIRTPRLRDPRRGGNTAEDRRTPILRRPSDRNCSGARGNKSGINRGAAADDPSPGIPD